MTHLATDLAPRTGGQIVVAALEAQGVERVFLVPGESYLAILDALHDSPIETVVCRHEGGAGMMAEADGKLKGRPGIAMVTRGPGATNAAHAVHVAMQDSTPLIVLVGQVERGFLGREAFQEIDYPAFFGPVAKWAVTAHSAARLPEILGRAFRVAMQGRPGPVVVALPEDVLTETAAVADLGRIEPAPTWPGLAEMMRLQALLWAARRPLVVAGGPGWTDAACAALVRFAERFEVPVATSFRRQGVFPSSHPAYAGDLGIGPNPALAARVREADVLVLLGGRLSEMPSSSYSLVAVPSPAQTLVHVHADAGELGRVYQPALAIHAGSAPFCAALEGLQPPNAIPWSGEATAAHTAFLAWNDPPATPGAFDYTAALVWLRTRLPDDAIICNGAGNFAIWVQRILRFERRGTQLAPTSGSMGYGLPAAIAAKLRHPDRLVVCFAGDGDFQMTGQELATAVQAGAAVIVLVIDNARYGTIRMHQERAYPGRVSGTELVNPDFAALAHAHGALGLTVETTAAFAPAFEAAVAAGRPALIHCRLDPEAVTPALTLSALQR